MIHVLITGAGSGLGRSLAIELAQRNIHLLLSDKSIEGLDQTQAMVSEAGGNCTTYPFDLSNQLELVDWIMHIIDEHTTVDWLINCAGFSITSAALDLKLEQWQKIVSINLQASITLSTICAQHMVRHGSGRIINVASMFGQLPAPSGIAYATTKHALIGFTRTLEVELRETGVQTHLVCPGFLNTSLFDNAEYVGISKTLILPDTSKMMSPKQAAKQILMGVDANKAWIIFPLYVRLLWWLEWCFPTLALTIWTREWKKFTQRQN